MKATGIVRNLDGEGRLTIPAETRRVFGLDILAPVEVFTTEDSIIVKPYRPDLSCVLCGKSEKGMDEVGSGKSLCQSCINVIKSL